MASAMGLPVGRVVRAMLQSTSRALVLALAWARACPRGLVAWRTGRPVGRAVRGGLSPGLAAFRGLDFWKKWQFIINY